MIPFNEVEHLKFMRDRESDFMHKQWLIIGLTALRLVSFYWMLSNNIQDRNTPFMLHRIRICASSIPIPIDYFQIVSLFQQQQKRRTDTFQQFLHFELILTILEILRDNQTGIWCISLSDGQCP